VLREGYFVDFFSVPMEIMGNIWRL